MGLGAAFVMPATLSILNAVFPPKERPQAIAAWSAVTGIGIVIGPTLGGLLLTHFWWGSVFLINIPLVAVALAGVILTVPETAEPGGRRLDLPGAVLIGGALFAIVDAIIEAPGRGWTGTATLAETPAGLAAPAGTPIMPTVPARQAGAGRAINDTIREVGGALGIAIVGSLAAAVYRSRLPHVLTARHAPGPVAHLATSSVAAADSIGRHIGGLQGSELVGAAHSAFVNAMAMGVRVAARVALIS